ncbi:MAG: NAD-dependent epimerase/dehydratase family protein [Planctomycetota bacterium]|jgi:nucleoside-diphosphate-sugar epimerase
MNAGAEQPDPVLVTGATGFTGGALARKLRESGVPVRALVRPGSETEKLNALGVDLVEGDLTDLDSVAGAMTGCRRVYHVAATFRTAGHPDSYYHDVNVRGTEHVLESARKQGVERTVHLSTVGVHGHVSRIPSDETAPYNPGDIYQVTKLEGEQRAQDAIRRGQPVSIVRPAGIYGPGDLRFLKLFKTVHKRTFLMFGSGEVPYHFTYIDDLVLGILLCGEHPAALGEIFIIGGDEYVSLNDLVRMVADAVGVRPRRGHLPLWPLLLAARLCEGVCKPFGIDPPLHMRRCEFFIKARAFTNAKARDLLGYRPQVPLEEGIRKTAEWYFEEGLLRRRAT